MLEIWGRRNASNVMPVMWAVAELDLAHLRIDVGGSFGGLDTPGYRELNPNGRIPTIRDGDLVLWESNAIVRYLARRYGAGSLLPDDAAGQAHADQWMEWHRNGPYRPYIDLFWAIVRTEPALRDADRIARLARATAESLAVLEGHLDGRRYIVGDRPTMADIPFGPMIHRYFALPVERPELPNISAWYDRLRARPGFAAHVMFPFGQNPAEWYLCERRSAE
jgi:glutathione S-transferase